MGLSLFELFGCFAHFNVGLGGHGMNGYG
jgi:uncharacterized membrane protein